MTSKKTLSLIFVGLVLNLFFFHTTVTAGTKEEKFAVKVKAGIEKIGVGKESRVKVKLKDGSKIEGYVSKIADDSFTVVNEKNNAVIEIQYSKARQIKGNNLSTGAAIAIGVGLAVLLGIIVALTWD